MKIIRTVTKTPKSVDNIVWKVVEQEVCPDKKKSKKPVEHFLARSNNTSRTKSCQHPVVRPQRQHKTAGTAACGTSQSQLWKEVGRSQSLFFSTLWKTDRHTHEIIMTALLSTRQEGLVQSGISIQRCGTIASYSGILLSEPIIMIRTTTDPRLSIFSSRVGSVQERKSKAAPF